MGTQPVPILRDHVNPSAVRVNQIVCCIHEKAMFNVDANGLHPKLACIVAGLHYLLEWVTVLVYLTSQGQ